MSKKVPIRDVSPALQIIRNVLLGRSHILALRFEDEVATRTPPLPVLPDGPSHRLHTNYYCNRDARREVAPPVDVNTQAKIGEDGKAKMCTPGKPFLWD